MTISDATRTTIAMLGLTPAEVGRERNSKPTMIKASICWWLCRQLTNCTLTELGDEFGGRSHTTIMHGIHQIDAKMTEDRMFAEAMTALRDSVRAVNRERVREEL